MLIDNKINRYPDSGLNITTVWDFLSLYSGKESGESGSFDIVTGYFTIYTLSKLYEDMPEDSKYRIISSEMVGDDYKKDLIVNLLGDELDIQSIGSIDKYAKQAIAFLERPTVEMRAEIPDFCHAKAYLFQNANPRGQSYYVSGSSNLTPAGVGLKPVPNVELNIAQPVNSTNTDYVELRGWYEDIWQAARTEVPEDIENKKSPKIPVKEYFIRKIREYFRTYSPEEIYYKILFELFNSELALDEGIEHQKDMSLLQTSAIWKTLFTYQQKGVISLIKMLRKYNGAILADAVGLGKTFSALAVIKYFQTQNYTTVLLCPKKLEQNWTQYLKGAGSRFEKDEFDYAVRFHTDMQNERLQTSYSRYRLDYLQSRKKLLIVIDESHNLRNEKSGRYKELLSSLIQSPSGIEGRDVKVLMLSATPINTGLNDVKGQFNLIGHGQDDAFDSPEFEVESLKNLFADAQRKYTIWCDDPARTIGGFISMLPTKFFNLTDRLIVARTRKMIESTLGEDLGFPEKDRPVNIYQGVDHFGSYNTTEEIYSAFENLNLTAYQPSLYLYENKKAAEKEASQDWDDDINRERFLVKMMGILFMKRLESSWYSCLNTVKKVLDVHDKTLKMVLDYEEKKAGGKIDIESPEDINEEDDNIIDDLYALRKGSINLAAMKNLRGFKKGLQHDVQQLKEISNNLSAFEQKYRLGEEKDLKLDELAKLLHTKQGKQNKKVVIFTAYADTAQFIFDELKNRGFTRMASASGEVINTTGHQNTTNYTQILQCFAPYSKLYKELDWDGLYEDAGLDMSKYYNNSKQRWEVDYDTWRGLVRAYRPSYAALLDDELDILIATDCLSEGQNLQDADMQINYDIHWNPVRLIQRFGRIDRIGSPNQKISCVNFWPEKSFEDYLHLETRIMNRMAIMNLAGSETQELNDQYSLMVADNTLNDKNAIRLLAELRNNSISDIESAKSLSLKDFSLETYRQDLTSYFDQQRDFYRRMPNGVFSGFINEAEAFAEQPDSLIALVGYPKKNDSAKTHIYSELYLMCQPIDGTLATYHEINKAEILEYLRLNKTNDRFVPQWIIENDSERISKLSNVLKEWMSMKAPKQAMANIKDRLRRKKATTTGHAQDSILAEDKFRIENFDLIVWEFATKKMN